MRIFLKYFFTFVFSIILLGIVFAYLPVKAQDASKLTQLSEEIQKYENELKRLGAEKSTLSNQIAQYDAQIKLTTLKISQTEARILLLGGRIDRLQGSLDSLKDAFVIRANQTYKMSRFSEPYLLLFTSPNLEGTVSSFHYLKRIQEADRSLLDKLKVAQEAYLEEKSTQEELQNQLESQKRSLASQKSAKTRLLEQTKNDEIKYQQLLSQARSEFEAIQAIIAGKGQESEVGHVNEGDRIASIIQGASCNSSGSWNWPINEQISFSQGFGSTWAVRNTWVGRVYNFHNGIDIDSNSSATVKAVRGGTLYRGSYAGSGGCRLRYVRVNHDENDLETYYLHINY